MHSNTYQTEPVQLAHTEAIEYRRFVQRIIQKRRPVTATNQNHADLNRLYERLESAFRRWVSASVTTIDQRILKYLITTPTLGIHHWNYRELDVVCGENRDHVDTVIELKSPHSLRSKTKKQLRKSLEIIQCRWPEARGIWVNLYLGEVLGTAETKSSPSMESCKAGWKQSLTRSQAEQRSTQDDIQEIWLDGKEFMDMCIQLDWLPSDFPSQLRELHQAVHPQLNSSFFGHKSRQALNPLSDSLHQWISQIL